MLTWTTYGTWLQGHKKGYVKEGKILEPSETLEKDNLSRLKCSPFRLNHHQKIIVETAIKKKALESNQKISAIIVYSNHVHVVVEKDSLSIEETVSYYKNAASIALLNLEFSHKVMVTGFRQAVLLQPEGTGAENCIRKKTLTLLVSPQVYLGGLVSLAFGENWEDNKLRSGRAKQTI